MKDLNININSELKMSSREIAELTGKRHDHVMRDIKGMFSVLDTSPNLGRPQIELSKYTDKLGREYPEYLLGKNEVLCLVTGYSTTLRMMVINRWQELEQQNQYKGRTLPKSWSETLEMLALEVKENEKLQNQLEEAQPQIAFANSVKASKDCILVGQLAVLLKQSGLDIGEKRLFKWLRTNNYLCKDKSRWNKPTQKSMDLDLFKYEETSINRSNGIILLNFTPKVTGKGQEYFINKLLANQNLLTNEDNNIHILQSEVQC